MDISSDVDRWIDEGMAHPLWESRVAAILDESKDHRGSGEPRRYLGASVVGHECDRALWMAAHGVTPDDVKVRTRSIFLAGHFGEAMMIAALHGRVRGRVDGVQMRYRVGDISGSPDGVLCGAPSGISGDSVYEVKTVGASVYSQAKRGVVSARYQVQVQCAMRGLGMDRAFITYLSRVDFSHVTVCVERDDAVVDRALERARVAHGVVCPAPIGDGVRWPCSMCSYTVACRTGETRHAMCEACVSWDGECVRGIDGPCGEWEQIRWV